MFFFYSFDCVLVDAISLDEIQKWDVMLNDMKRAEECYRKYELHVHCKNLSFLAGFFCRTSVERLWFTALGSAVLCRQGYNLEGATCVEGEKHLTAWALWMSNKWFFHTTPCIFPHFPPQAFSPHRIMHVLLDCVRGCVKKCKLVLE